VCRYGGTNCELDRIELAVAIARYVAPYLAAYDWELALAIRSLMS
jgi:hypothetical protein